MFDVVLYQPEIPPNTGNVLRLCANTGCRLHLVRPLGFLVTDRALRRAGLDYDEIRAATLHDDWDAARARTSPVVALCVLVARAAHLRGRALRSATTCSCSVRKPAGCPTRCSGSFPPEHRLRIPMRPGMRSVNLSNAVAVVVYEAWRQAGFAGPPGV